MTHLSGPRSPRDVVLMMGIAGCVALAAIVLAAVVLVRHAPSLVRAMIVPAVGSGAEQEADAARIERFRSSFDGQLAQIGGRSMFFVPSAPPPAPVRTAVADSAPRPPTRYDGPAIVAMINGTVWFADGRRLKVGDDGEDSLSVISIDPPWGARVRWRSVEFDVSLFERTTSRFMERDSAPTQPETVEEDHASSEEGVKETTQTQEEVATGEAELPEERDPA